MGTTKSACMKMPRYKELPKALRKKVGAAHKRGEGYKTISKQPGLQVLTVRQVVYIWRNFQTTACLPRSGRPRKISDKTARKLISEASKNPKVTSRELQVNLGQAGVPVHSSTIRRTLNQSDLHGRVARKKPLLKKQHKKD